MKYCVAAVLLVIVFTLLLYSCSSVAYQPDTFREDLRVLIEKEQHRRATKLLDRVDIQAQLAHDGQGYVLIAEDLIYRPGVPEASSDPVEGDWEIPGTSDTNTHQAWQEAAKSFAEQYNAARWAVDHP